jgi:hypothetical protein
VEGRKERMVETIRAAGVLGARGDADGDDSGDLDDESGI